MKSLKNIDWTILKTFWAKIKTFIGSRVTESGVRKIVAAFGTLLLTILTGATPVVSYYINLSISNIIVQDFIVGIWYAFVMFLGVIIVTFFGTTDKLSDADRETIEYVRKKIKEVEEKSLKDTIIVPIKDE